MTLIELLTMAVSFLNTGILTSIYYKLGRHDEKHKNHENRLLALEGRFICSNA